jgi:homoserine kinase type II
MYQVDLGELRSLVEDLVSNAQVLQEAIDRNYVTEHLRDILSVHYDIGGLTDIRKLDRGYVNASYLIMTAKEKHETRHFLRRYKRGIREEELRFEHSIVKHLMKKGFDLSAALVLRNETEIHAATGTVEIKMTDSQVEV